jgi:4-amino-4-deoxy-L-arabinose transferase-like glycosyltransferase
MTASVPQAAPAPSGRGQRLSRQFLTRDRIVTLGLFGLALALRAWGVQWSLPYVGHVDEPKIVDSAVHMVKTGDLNPHLFIWPSGVIYIQALIDKLNLIWGTWRGYYHGPDSLPDSNHIFAVAPGLYLWGRLFSATVGAVAVAGLYALGRRMVGRPAAALAAGLLLVSPLHVEYSHYLVTDVTMGACGLLALAAAWHLVHTPTRRAALLAGAAVGLATAAKYNGLYTVIPVGIAWALAFVLTTPRRWGTALLAALLMALAGLGVFLLLNPYVILDWADWSHGFIFQVNAYLPADTPGQIVGAAGKQLGQLWQPDPLLLGVGVAGWAILLADTLWHWRTRPDLRLLAALLLPFPVLYWLLMSRFTEVYVRNLIVTLPYLALAGGYGAARLAAGVRDLWSVARVRGSGVAGQGSDDGENTQHATRNRNHVSRFTPFLLALLLLADPARRVINFDRYMADTESRNAAWAWLQGELQDGRRAVVELHPLQACAAPVGSCPAPDVLAPNAPLTARLPAWYAAHGYDYAVLVGDEVAVVGNNERRGPPGAAYTNLPLVRLFPGDDGGGKGPLVRVLRVGSGLDGLAGYTRSGARFAPVADLWGYALAPLATAGDPFDPADRAPNPASTTGGESVYHPGAAVGVRLAWRGLPDAAAQAGNWMVALHLLDAAGKTVAQVDIVPLSAGRLRPVAAWYANEFLDGSYNIPLPPDLPAGSYHLTLALYDAPAGRALPVQLPGGPTVPVLDLGQLQVAPK